MNRLFHMEFNHARGDMIFGLSSAIKSYSWPHHYKKICCIPISPNPDVSFLGRFNKMINAQNAEKILYYGMEPHHIDEDKDILTYELSISAGVNPSQIEAMSIHQLYVLCYFLLWVKSSRFNKICDMINTQFTEVQKENKQGISDVRVIMSSLTRQMNKFAIESTINDSVLDYSNKLTLSRHEAPKIHFALDGINMNDTVHKVRTTAQNVRSDYTNSELRYIFRQRNNLNDKVIFYRDKIEVDAPWIEMPDLWKNYEKK